MITEVHRSSHLMTRQSRWRRRANHTDVSCADCSVVCSTLRSQAEPLVMSHRLLYDVVAGRHTIQKVYTINIFYDKLKILIKQGNQYSKILNL